MIVKIVNSSENIYELKLDGDWKGLGNASYRFIAPGALNAANSLESPYAVNIKDRILTPSNNSVSEIVDALSTGVLRIIKKL